MINILTKEEGKRRKKIFRNVAVVPEKSYQRLFPPSFFQRERWNFDSFIVEHKKPREHGEVKLQQKQRTVKEERKGREKKMRGAWGMF